MNNDLINDAIENGLLPEPVIERVRISQDNQEILLGEIRAEREKARDANARARDLNVALEDERERLSDELAQYLDGAQVFVREREDERDNLRYRLVRLSYF